ncbi:MAG: hypothetical protein IJ667_12935, partial [Synergistaceae bacterium]|nr:hypothetical protein [Synergistaceae bacterium]
MLPDIAKWVSANPTATPAKFAAKIANDLYAPAYAAKGYVEKIASADQLAAGADFVLNWAVSTEVGYPSATPATVKVYLLKDETVTVPLAITTANLIDANKKATDIKADTKIVHAEVASKDAASKIVYGPEDITKGLVLDKAFIAAHPDLLVRVMFTSKGDQTLMTNSVGILKEGQDTIDQGGTLPDKTLTKAPVSDYVNLNPSLFTALAEGYPYFVEFPLQLAVSFDTGSGSSSETTTAETYKLKASDVVLTGSDGQSKTVAASTSYSISQDSATKDALWTAAPVVFSVSSDQFASFEITVSADANVIAAKDADGGEVTVSGKKVEVLGIEGTYTIILSSDLVASSDGTVSTD